MEAYQAKLPLLSLIPKDQVFAPTIPTDVLVQEANNLAYWAKQDRAALASVNFDTTLIDDLPVRAGACREAESIWLTQRFTKEEALKEWKLKLPSVIDLRYTIERAMEYAFRKNPDLLVRLELIKDGSGNADLIQDLNDLQVLGRQYEDLLKAINFDMALLDQAAKLAIEMADLLATATGNKANLNQVKDIRDRAYTHLKEAMTEIRQCGQYVFADDKERLQGYYSSRYKNTSPKKSSRQKENITA